MVTIAAIRKTVRLMPCRPKPHGKSAEGVSVVAVKGYIGSKDQDITNLRLDSGADVTLISEEFYTSMKNPP